MKQIGKIALTLLLATTLFSACKKENEPGEWMRFSSNIDETSNPWYTEEVTVQAQLGGFLISGIHPDGSTLQLLIKGSAVSNYEVEIGDATAAYRAGADPLKIFVGESGLVTLTEVNSAERRIQGTFNVRVVNSITESGGRINGSFRTKF